MNSFKTKRQVEPRLKCVDTDQKVAVASKFHETALVIQSNPIGQIGEYNLIISGKVIHRPSV